MQKLKKLSICGVLVAVCCYLVPALGSTIYVPGVGKLTQQDLNSANNDYVGGVTEQQGTASGSVVQPKIVQPQIAGVANNAKPTEQPDSNVVYVLKKKGKNKFGGSERQANTLKKYLGVNY